MSTLIDFGVTRSGEQSCQVRRENDLPLITDQEFSVTGAENPQRSELANHMVDDAQVPNHHVHCHLSQYRQEHETVECCGECYMPDRKNPSKPTTLNNSNYAFSGLSNSAPPKF